MVSTRHTFVFHFPFQFPLFTFWVNLCLKYNYLPLVLRQGEVVYFLSQGKSDSELKLYRPICLVPTLGKLLEELIVFWISNYLESNSFLHSKPIWFIEDRWCEKSLHAIMTSCVDSIAQGNYASLVSLDIQGNFDNVVLCDIMTKLQALNYSGNIARTCLGNIGRIYLRALINWSTGTSSHRLQKDFSKAPAVGQSSGFW